MILEIEHFKAEAWFGPWVLMLILLPALHLVHVFI